MNLVECTKCGQTMVDKTNENVNAFAVYKVHGKRVMRKLSFMLFTLVFVLCSCSSWKSPDGKSEKEILEIGYDTGYEWGSEFGVRMYENDGWERLQQAAKREYFGELVTSEIEFIKSSQKSYLEVCRMVFVNILND